MDLVRIRTEGVAMKISEFAETPPCEIESDREFRPYWGRKLSVNGDEMLL